MHKKPTALITGASRGIGRAAASELDKAGFRLALHYNRNRAAAESLQAELTDETHILVSADLSNASETQTLWQESVDQLGKISVLVNNAGIYELHDPVMTAPEVWSDCWNRTIQVDLNAPAMLSIEAARHMKSAGSGRIINVTSRGAFRGEPAAPAYGAAKSGLNSFSQSLAQALAAAGVLVFAVAPGFVETDMAAEILSGPQGTGIKKQSPLNRAATAEEIGGVIKYLATDAPAYMTGAILDVNGASYLRN